MEMTVMNESLVLVGMNVRPLAQSAVKAGFEVVAIDAFGHLDLPSEARCLSLAKDLGGLFPFDPHSWHLRLAQAIRLEKANSLAYSGGFENLPDLVAEMSEDRELLGNSPASLRAVRDPFHLQEVVKSVGMETPQILPPGAQPDPGLRWLHKPLKSGMGHGIEPWDSIVPDDPESSVQRWVEGVPHSASFIANGEKAQVFSVTHQLSGDPAFGAQGFAYVGNLLLPHPEAGLLSRLNLLATALTQAFGLVGLNGIDFVLNGEQVSILEVNPRYSASMELVEEALGVPILEWHTAGCRRQSLPVLPERRDQNVFGKAVVYARRNGILPDTTHWQVRGRRDVPYAGGSVRAGLPICTVTALGHDQQQCYAYLLAEAEELLNMA
jgi:predicted ATP-grasp superfamily ATP-dependent carboligase